MPTFALLFSHFGFGWRRVGAGVLPIWVLLLFFT
jgi:hypothetical protein